MDKSELNKIGKIMKDALNLINDEKFYFSDCIVIHHSELVGYRIVNNKLEIDHNIEVDTSDWTDIFQKFSLEVDNSIYLGGEVSAHSSSGFFYKKTGDYLDWLLMSLDSDPFVNIEYSPKVTKFLSSSGSKWVVPDDDITKLYIENKFA